MTPNIASVHGLMSPPVRHRLESESEHASLFQAPNWNSHGAASQESYNSSADGLHFAGVEEEQTNECGYKSRNRTNFVFRRKGKGELCRDFGFSILSPSGQRSGDHAIVIILSLGKDV